MLNFSYAAVYEAPRVCFVTTQSVLNHQLVLPAGAEACRASKIFNTIIQ